MSEFLQGPVKTVVVTGGCGFIGSAVVRKLLRDTDVRVVNVDLMTYAASDSVPADDRTAARYHFIKADIASHDAVTYIFEKYNPDAVMNLAAETHVDRSINGPQAFFHSNLQGVLTLLEVAREHSRRKPTFRFHQVSTDEVFGSLASDDPSFTESNRYDPSSPYSATKAGADHLVRAWHKTFDLDVVLTNCSNNYGPRQFPEKLIPLIILNALTGNSLPVYGDGRQVREWLFVDDHADALVEVLCRGVSGESYNIGSGDERTNIDVVRSICRLLDERSPETAGFVGHDRLITYVPDRPAHDRRYAINSSKIRRELGWRSAETFEIGLGKTVDWYIRNRHWWELLGSQSFQQRLGLKK